MSAPLFTVDDFAARIRTTPTAIRRMRERGTLPPAIKVGARILWDSGEVEAWLKKQREPEPTKVDLGRNETAGAPLSRSLKRGMQMGRATGAER